MTEPTPPEWREALAAFVSAQASYVDAVLAHRRHSRVLVVYVTLNAVMSVALMLRGRVDLGVILACVAGAWAIVDSVSLVLNYRALVRLRTSLDELDTTLVGVLARAFVPQRVQETP